MHVSLALLTGQTAAPSSDRRRTRQYCPGPNVVQRADQESRNCQRCDWHSPRRVPGARETRAVRGDIRRSRQHVARRRQRGAANARTVVRTAGVPPPWRSTRTGTGSVRCRISRPHVEREAVLVADRAAALELRAHVPGDRCILDGRAGWQRIRRPPSQIADRSAGIAHAEKSAARRLAPCLTKQPVAVVTIGVPGSDDRHAERTPVSVDRSVASAESAASAASFGALEGGAAHETTAQTRAVRGRSDADTCDRLPRRRKG